jgi:hypothetical protein
METKSKDKKPKEFEKIKGSGNLFKSYIHNFNGYKKLMAALHHIQKAETLYVTSQTSTSFKLEKIEDSIILEYVGYIFDAVVHAEDDCRSATSRPKADDRSFATSRPKADVPDDDLICTIYFMDGYKKTKTYIFQHSADFYKRWLSDKLPLIIGRNRNVGMTRLRLLSLREDTKNALEKNLDLKAKVHYIPEVYNEYGAYVNSIEMDL